uniref:DIS3-like exonuclease 1 n=1 Tax=Macrostomum lignano TaxID=282301 RepID=A0A1I8HB46_9PLAT
AAAISLEGVGGAYIICLGLYVCGGLVLLVELLWLASNFVRLEVAHRGAPEIGAQRDRHEELLSTDGVRPAHSKPLRSAVPELEAAQVSGQRFAGKCGRPWHQPLPAARRSKEIRSSRLGSADDTPQDGDKSSPQDRMTSKISLRLHQAVLGRGRPPGRGELLVDAGGPGRKFVRSLGVVLANELLLLGEQQLLLGLSNKADDGEGQREEAGEVGEAGAGVGEAEPVVVRPRHPPPVEAVQAHEDDLDEDGAAGQQVHGAAQLELLEIGRQLLDAPLGDVAVAGEAADDHCGDDEEDEGEDGQHLHSVEPGRVQPAADVVVLGVVDVPAAVVGLGHIVLGVQVAFEAGGPQAEAEEGALHLRLQLDPVGRHEGHKVQDAGQHSADKHATEGEVPRQAGPKVWCWLHVVGAIQSELQDVMRWTIWPMASASLCADAPVLMATQRANKHILLRLDRGRRVRLVREVYLRSDVPCCSELCRRGCQAPADGCASLPAALTHYVLPDCAAARAYWELFELPEVEGVLLTLTSLHHIQGAGGRRLYNRVKSQLRDPRQSTALFDNEFQAECWRDRRPGESEDQHAAGLNWSAARWYAQHLDYAIPIVLVTDGTVEPCQPEDKGGVDVLSVADYVARFHGDKPQVTQIFESLRASLAAAEAASSAEGSAGESTRGDYPEHLSAESLKAGVKSGQFLQGCLHVSRKSGQDTAVVSLSGGAQMLELKASRGEILIVGQRDRNRAVHGDIVCVQLLPKASWAQPVEGEQQTADSAAAPTGRVVGIAQRNWRDYVCSVEPAADGSSKDSGASKRILAVPWDRRVPKIRIATSQAAALASQRFVVRIDAWPADSQYPNGHFVRPLGAVGHLETETQALLIEHGLAVREFSAKQLAELPAVTEDQPWQVDPQEVAKRRDLRQSHLVFSIDPVGCVDVDDTLSVRVCVPVSEYPWVYVPVSEYPRVYLPVSEYPRVCVPVSEYPRVCVPVSEYPRVCVPVCLCPIILDSVCQCPNILESRCQCPNILESRRLDNGNIELGVHIADVTHFVKANSLCDIEARQRCTSIYLADRRYDMLPLLLSGNLCSLWSQVDRYAVSVIWELTPDTEVVSVWYGRTVIRSAYKLFYEMAQRIHDGEAMETAVPDIPELAPLLKRDRDLLRRRFAQLREAVSLLVGVANTIKARRMACGGLELEGVEVQAKFADPERTQLEDLVIAECMIFANHWVARKIVAYYPSQSCLRRHPPPRQEFFDSLIRCAQARGFTIKADSNRQLAESLDSCVDPADPEVNRILRTLATQAMSNALYFSTGALPRDQFAHYGLALDLYTHFTSPIRRYADILVHRCLLAALGDSEAEDALLPNQELEAQCCLMNERHRAAQHAQMASMQLFQCLFFRARPPTDPLRLVEAVVCQVRDSSIGVFVPRYGIKGSVRLARSDGSVLDAGPPARDLRSVQAAPPLAEAAPDGCGPRWIPAGSGASVSRDPSGGSLRVSTGPEQKQQVYSLFDHLVVRVSVAESHSHGPALQLDLVARLVSKDAGAADAGGGGKADLVRQVREREEQQEEERRRDLKRRQGEEEGGQQHLLQSTGTLYHFLLDTARRDAKRRRGSGQD